jgi:hypothetical protein
MTAHHRAGSRTAPLTTFRRAALAAGGLLLAATVIVAASPAPAFAQSGSGDGFLFGAPAASLTLRAGFARANASSVLFSFTTDQLTLDRGSFSGPALELDLGFAMGSRAEVVVSSGYAGKTSASELRHFVDQNDLAIEQSTRFQRLPLTIGVKAYLVPRGREIGKLAWIPSRVAPYVGVGGGATWYKFRQSGDWVDINTNAIFPAIYETSGWAPTAHAMAGLDVSLSPRLALTTQARYTWAKTKPAGDFTSFDAIDLSGLSTTAGLSIRF